MKRFLLAVSVFATLLTGCEKLKPVLTVDPESFTFYIEGKGQITTNVEDATFQSDDEFYATVDATGLVTAQKVGNTNITVSSSIGSKKIPVTILPKYDLYPDLDGLIGKTQASVVALLGNDYTSSTTKDGDLMIGYKNVSKYCDAIVVSFKGSLVNAIMSMVPMSYMDMLISALKERYSFAGTLNDTYFFPNHDKSAVACLAIYSLTYLSVTYIPYETTKANGDSQVYYNEFLKQFIDVQ